MTDEKKVILRLENIDKSFGPTHANDHVNMELYAGEIRGFAGENGSGKSTLSSIVAAIHRPDSGAMYLNGELYAPKSIPEANKLGVAMVVQELGVIPSLPVTVNMYMGRTNEFATAGIINFKKMRKAAQEVIDKWEIGPIKFSSSAGELSIEERKMIELARALSVDPQILILDEITQALSRDLREKLYKLMKKFTSMGRTILMITHDMDEMLEIADNITVLRDGQVVGTEAIENMDMDKLRRMMIGREIKKDYYRADEEETHSDKVILDIQHIKAKGVNDISFQLHEGEILAVCGLSGAGIHDLGKAIYGTAEHRTGKVIHAPTGKQIKKPIDMLKFGGAYLSKDRDIEGLMLRANIRNNVVVPSVGELAVGPAFVNPMKVKKLSKKAFDDFDIKATGIDHVVGSLSGGNKQKVNLSRWLVKDLQYVILDCPTRGVDIGVKAYIYHLMQELKAKGLAILMITDELPEAMGMADRIMVMKDGNYMNTLSRSSHFTEEAIIKEMI